jgi:hypothetical protein
MLRITEHDASDRLTLQLEGRLAGAWVGELEDCWRHSAARLEGRGLHLDLTGVVFVDAAGKYLLTLMHKAGARFIALGCDWFKTSRRFGLKYPHQGPGGTDTDMNLHRNLCCTRKSQTAQPAFTTSWLTEMSVSTWRKTITTAGRAIRGPLGYRKPRCRIAARGTPRLSHLSG